MAIVIKLTRGYVTQTFQDGKLRCQQFITSDESCFEDINGEPIARREYRKTLCHSFEMVQPKTGSHSFSLEEVPFSYVTQGHRITIEFDTISHCRKFRRWLDTQQEKSDA